ncbi:hypothetical protein B0T49_20910 [Chromobacterium violaceum]|uniref:hypothetical protein n=1 Tax=Chromobacterium violaceum TaxID=536 RepID=UPI0009F0CD7E|nr:hypothetical protein [Chromobacterium violaceum]OQS45866.1 hypothetical protein B0T49_20910 [Chromobacterium violaceum]OQS47499.1 hypothetical protein B0T48_12520 [Chromobacterium violaceum]
MQFMIKNDGLARVPAEIHARAESGEHVITIQLTGRLLSQPAWDELFQRHAAADEAADLSAIYRQNARLYFEVFTAWDGVQDQHKQPVPLSLETLEAALLSIDGPAVNAALQRAVHELRFGGAVRKN